jgi:hypothetical protein
MGSISDSCKFSCQQSASKPQGIVIGVSHDKQAGNVVIGCSFLGVAFSEKAILRGKTSCDTR